MSQNIIRMYGPINSEEKYIVPKSIEFEQYTNTNKKHYFNMTFIDLSNNNLGSEIKAIEK